MERNKRISSSLSPINIQKEYERENPIPKETNKSVTTWYSEFIAVKEKIGEGINSYRATFSHFKTFTAKRETSISY